MIDPRADIHPDAKLGPNVTVGPWSIIEKNVSIGEGTIIGPQVVIQGPTKIGAYNQIFQFASVGAMPQDKKYAEEETVLEIGDHNIIREFVTLNRGTVQGGNVTRIGDHNLFMAYTHVAHDCIIGNHVILANYAALSGHVIVEDWAILSGFTGVHQYCTIGAHAFVGNDCKLVQDVLPYVMIAGGVEPKPYGLNSVGLRRRDFSDETLNHLKKAYRIIFRQDNSIAETLVQLENLLPACPEIGLMINAIKKSTRGFVR
jgi:UDP-N-acetylglucosamine acyltransferase